METIFFFKKRLGPWEPELRRFYYLYDSPHTLNYYSRSALVPRRGRRKSSERRTTDKSLESPQREPAPAAESSCVPALIVARDVIFCTVLLQRMSSTNEDVWSNWLWMTTYYRRSDVSTYICTGNLCARRMRVL